MYKNEEIQNLILALELVVKSEDFKKESLRYQKALFDEGSIYVGVPALYKLERGKQIHCCYDDGELIKLQRTFPSNASFNIQRFKGLGEMMPSQLCETTVDPDRRVLKQLVVENAAEASVIFSSHGNSG